MCCMVAGANLGDQAGECLLGLAFPLRNERVTSLCLPLTAPTSARSSHALP